MGGVAAVQGITFGLPYRGDTLILMDGGEGMFLSPHSSRAGFCKRNIMEAVDALTEEKLIEFVNRLLRGRLPINLVSGNNVLPSEKWAALVAISGYARDIPTPLA